MKINQNSFYRVPIKGPEFHALKVKLNKNVLKMIILVPFNILYQYSLKSVIKKKFFLYQFVLNIKLYLILVIKFID